MLAVVPFVLLLCGFNLVYGQCPDGFVNHGQFCYHFSHDTETWIDAQRVCQHYNGFLAEIDDAVENNFLGAKAAEYHAEFWIGANDLMVEGEWRWWSDGRRVSFTNFGTPPSNSNGDENCVELLRSASWNDNSCHRTLRYICEITKEAATVIG